MYAVARDHPGVPKLVRIGTTGRGREILAVVLMGFGFEGILTQASRNAVMGRLLDHLLD